MGLSDSGRYGLIVSAKVFEPRGMYHTQQGAYISPQADYSHEDLARKLFELLTRGGHAILATATQSLFTKDILEKAKLQVLFRGVGWVKLVHEQEPIGDERDEIILLKRKL